MQGMNYNISEFVLFCVGKYIKILHVSPLSSEDPWSSSGYSAMLGHSPHIGQAGSFSAINPQDRMVCRKYCTTFISIIIWKFNPQSSMFMMR